MFVASSSRLLFSKQVGISFSQIREEVCFTKGRIIVRGKLVTRGKAERADYLLYYKPNIPIALIEAKDNTFPVGAGMQQALEYGMILNIPFVRAGIRFCLTTGLAAMASLRRRSRCRISLLQKQIPDLEGAFAASGADRPPELSRRWGRQVGGQAVRGYIGIPENRFTPIDSSSQTRMCERGIKLRDVGL